MSPTKVGGATGSACAHDPVASEIEQESQPAARRDRDGTGDHASTARDSLGRSIETLQSLSLRGRLEQIGRIRPLVDAADRPRDGADVRIRDPSE